MRDFLYAKQDTNDDFTHIHANSKLKNIDIKSSIQIKFRLHHDLSNDKMFKTTPHMTMFTGYFKKVLLILNN